MSGTTAVTQTTEAFVCQAIGGLTLQLNTLNSIDPNDIANGSIAKVVLGGQTWQWDENSMLPDNGTSVIAPLIPQVNNPTKGRWLLLTGVVPPGIFYQAITNTTVAGVTTALPQAGTLAFVNLQSTGSTGGPGGSTVITAANQQITFVDYIGGGPIVSEIQRPTLRVEQEQTLHPGSPAIVSVVDDPGTQSTVLQVWRPAYQGVISGITTFRSYNLAFVGTPVTVTDNGTTTTVTISTAASLGDWHASLVAGQFSSVGGIGGLPTVNQTDVLTIQDGAMAVWKDGAEARFKQPSNLLRWLGAVGIPDSATITYNGANSSPNHQPFAFYAPGGAGGSGAHLELYSAGAAAGGDILLNAGNSGTSGGGITATTGDGTNLTGGNYIFNAGAGKAGGGFYQFNGGSSSAADGGGFQFNGGNGFAGTGTGGGFSFTGGTGQTGGGFTVLCGAGTTGSGSVSMTAGTGGAFGGGFGFYAGSAGNAGGFTFTSGNAASNAGGDYSFTAGTGTVRGGGYTFTSGAGPDGGMFQFTGGAAGIGTGGGFHFTGGSSSGAGGEFVFTGGTGIAGGSFSATGGGGSAGGGIVLAGGAGLPNSGGGFQFTGGNGHSGGSIQFTAGTSTAGAGGDFTVNLGLGTTRGGNATFVLGTGTAGPGGQFTVVGAVGSTYGSAINLLAGSGPGHPGGLLKVRGGNEVSAWDGFVEVGNVLRINQTSDNAFPPIAGRPLPGGGILFCTTAGAGSVASLYWMDSHGTTKQLAP